MSLIGLDLDRTLIYSAAALELPGPDADAPPLVVAEVYAGAPLSFLTAAAAAELRLLSDLADVVPTTTRTWAQYRRVRIDGWQPRYAITTNGGVLLDRGRPDLDWDAQVRRNIAESAPLSAVAAHLERVAAAEWTLSRRTAEELFCYLVVDRAGLPDGFLPELTQWCLERGWSTSLQGRKIYCVPDGLTKRAALREVGRRLGVPGYLAAGDSLLDAELLDGARGGVRPAHGELADTGWSRPHIEVTDLRGVLGGAELVGRLLRLAKL
jgi:hypothetical protein